MVVPTPPPTSEIPEYVLVFTEVIEGLIEQTECRLPHHTGIFIQAIETMLARHKPTSPATKT